MTAKTAASVLSWLMIVMGAGAALAVVPMVMPTAWMVSISDALNVGPFPDSVLTEYLARTVSALYAMVGALVIYVGLNVRQYLSLVVVMGWLTMAVGIAFTGIDFAVGMPVQWSWSEGPPTVVVGLGFVWLAKRAMGKS